MRVCRIFAVLVAFFTIAACSSTGSSVSSNAAAENTVASVSGDGDDVICKRVQVTGTRMTEKVCTTKAQREARARNARDAAAQVGIKAQQVGGPAGG